MGQDEDAGGKVCDLSARIRDGEGTHGHVHLLKTELEGGSEGGFHRSFQWESRY